MSEFLKFYDKLRKRFPLHLEIYQSKICDWRIYIYKKGCASDYPNAKSDGDDVIVVEEQDNDVELLFAKAQVALKEWLREFNDGY